MPTVPTQVTQTQFTQPTSARVRASATDEEFGAGTGRAISGVGKSIQKVADRTRQISEENDLNEAKNAYVLASDELRGFLHGEDGIYSQRGRNAFDTTQATEEEITRISSEIKTRLGNKNQQAAFDSLWRTHRSSSLNGVAKHESRQRDVYDRDTTAAMLSNSMDNALNNFNDQQSIDESLETIEVAIRTNGQGQSGEVMNQQIEAARSNVHKGVIQRKLVDDPQGARDYYEQNKDDVEGKDHATIEAALKQGILRGDAQDKTDEIMATEQDTKVQLDTARKIENPELRDETVKRVKMRQREDASLQEEQKKKVISDGWLNLEAQMRAGSPIPELLKIQEKMPDRATRAAMEKVINKAISGEDVVTNWNKYYDLRRMSMENPQKFKNINLTQFFGDLATSEREGLVDLQQRIGPDGDTAGRTLNQLATQSLRQIGIDTGAAAGKGDQEKTSQFWRKLEAEIKNFKTENGREANREDQQKIIDNLIIEGEVKGKTIFNDPDVFFFEAEPGQEFFVEDVPAEDRAQIIDALKRAGRPVTNEAVVQLYTRKVTNQ